MLLLLVIDLVLNLFSWFFGLLPWPALSDLVSSLVQFLQPLLAVIPRALGIVSYFIGPTAWGILQFCVRFYFSVLDILLVYWGVFLLRKLFVFIKGLPFIS